MMINSTKLIIGVIVIAAFAYVSYVVVAPMVNSGVKTDSEISSVAKAYQMSEISKHSVAPDCWTVVDGKVYDLTPFIKKHPGGILNIVKVCGIDGTELFNNQHGGENDPKNVLTELYIGEIEAS